MRACGKPTRERDGGNDDINKCECFEQRNKTETTTEKMKTADGENKR